MVLYGVREQQPGHDAELHALLRTHAATVIALGWSSDTPQAQWALSCGAQAHLSKTLTGHELVARVEQVHRAQGRPRELPADGHCHPAVRAAGLTSRELQVMALVARGLTNQEIADRTYLSVNSVKTYVRTAYRKLDISRRSQAVSWGIQHGLDVEPTGEATVRAELEPSH